MMCGHLQQQQQQRTGSQFSSRPMESPSGRPGEFVTCPPHCCVTAPCVYCSQTGCNTFSMRRLVSPFIVMTKGSCFCRCCCRCCRGAKLYYMYSSSVFIMAPVKSKYMKHSKNINCCKSTKQTQTTKFFLFFVFFKLKRWET